MSLSLTNKHRDHDVSHQINAKAVKGSSCHTRNAILTEIHKVGPSFSGNHGKDIQNCVHDVVVAHVSPAWLVIDTLHTHLSKFACDAIITMNIDIDATF